MKELLCKIFGHKIYYGKVVTTHHELEGEWIGVCKKCRKVFK